MFVFSYWRFFNMDPYFEYDCMQANAKIVPRLVHNCVFLNPFQLLILQLSYHSMLQNMAIVGGLKYVFVGWMIDELWFWSDVDESGRGLFR
jgi:hypothetical protein